jgi:hypothetical protein
VYKRAVHEGIKCAVYLSGVNELYLSVVSVLYLNVISVPYLNVVSELCTRVW